MSTPYVPKVYISDRNVYDAIKAYTAENGHPPTLRDVANIVGLRTVSTVRVHYVSLRQKGLIEWTEGAARTVKIIAEWPTPPTGEVA